MLEFFVFLVPFYSLYFCGDPFTHSTVVIFAVYAALIAIMGIAAIVLIVIVFMMQKEE